MSRRRAASFLLIADEELEAVKRLLDSLPRQAAYFLSQAAKKLARAVASAEDLAVGPTHSIIRIVSPLPNTHPFKDRLSGFERLSPASTRYRYPGFNDRVAAPPPPETLRRDLGELERLRDDIGAWIASRRD